MRHPRQLLLFGQRIEAASLGQAGVEKGAGEPLTIGLVEKRDKHGRQQSPGPYCDRISTLR